MSRFSLKSPHFQLSENDVEKQCLDLLRIRQWWPIRLQSGKFKTVDNRWITVGQKGIPDYVVVHAAYPGFFLEVKRPGALPTAEQRDRIRELQFYELTVLWCSSKDELNDWLNDYEKRRKK